MTVVEITPQHAALLRAFDEINAKQEKTEKGFRENAREAQRLERVGKRAFESTRTPAERLEMKMQDLEKAWKANRISVDTWKRGALQAQNEYRRATRKSTDNTVEFGKSAKRAFGPEMLSNLKSMAGGVLGLGAAIGVFSQATQQAVEAAKQAGEAQRTSAFAVGELAQLAGGDPAKLKNLMLAKREIFLTAGGRDEAGAARLAFQLESGGALSERDFFARFSAIGGGLEGAAAAAGAASKIQSGFGRREAGNLEAITSKAFQAAKAAPEVGVREILAGLTPASSTAGELGVSDEESLAALAVLSQRAKSADVGGTQLSSFLTAAKQTGLADQLGDKFSIQAMVAEIKAKGLNKQELTKFLGRKEAATAYTFLSQADLGGLSQQIGEAERTQAARQAIRAFHKAAPNEAAALTLGRSEAMAQASADEIGRFQNLEQSIRKQDIAHLRRRGGSERVKAIGDWFDFSNWWESPKESAVAEMQRAVLKEINTPGERVYSDQLLTQILDVLLEQKDETSRLRVEAAERSEELQPLLNQRPAGDNLENHTE